MAVLVGVMLAYRWPLLIGYWIGALMHLILDILVNGDYALRRPLLFYFFTYRATHRFRAEALLDVAVPAEAGREPIREFFRWRPEAEEKTALRSKL
jgi:hypothetical protein